MQTNYSFPAKVWLYSGMAGWHFITVPKEIAMDIKKHFSPLKRGWGSLRVEVTVGKTVWKTSIFPDAKSGGFLLPIKADVRKKEHIAADETVQLGLRIFL